MTMTSQDRSGPDSATPAPTRLQARDVQLGYHDAVVIDGLELDIVQGTVTAVIGPNGCGKSTLLRALGRLLPTRRGGVLLDGQRIDKCRSAPWPRCWACCLRHRSRRRA